MSQGVSGSVSSAPFPIPLQTLGAITLTALLFPGLRHPIGVVVQDPAVFFWCFGSVLAAAVLVIRWTGKRCVGTGLLLGVAMLATMAAMIRGGFLMDLALSLPPDNALNASLLTAAIVQLVIVTMIAVATWVLGGRNFRRLPLLRYHTVTGLERRST